MSRLDSISEEAIAAAVMSTYEGELSNRDCQVSASTYGDDEEKVTTLAFIELAHVEDKISSLVCSSCGFEPSDSRDLEFNTRAFDGWIYDDTLCPSCEEVIHVELIKTPG